ncbi:MAG: hypothetical protein ACRBBW_15315 [Cellvibrionaceae bacterium]
MTHQTTRPKIASLQVTQESINLYQSMAMNDGFSFLVSSLDDQPLARLELVNNHHGEHWAVQTLELTVEQAKSLGHDLHLQHYQFYIHEGCFHITAWNLLDAHYICNLIALHEFGGHSSNTEESYAA